MVLQCVIIIKDFKEFSIFITLQQINAVCNHSSTILQSFQNIVLTPLYAISSDDGSILNDGIVNIKCIVELTKNCCFIKRLQ